MTTASSVFSTPPNDSHPSIDTSSPGAHRRGFLAGLASAAAAAAIAPAAAAAAACDDSELIALGRKISRLRELEKLAVEETSRLHAVAEEMTPPKPKTLLWRDRDPVPPELDIENGEVARWCSIPALSDLAKRPAESWIGRAFELISAWREWRAAAQEARDRSGGTAADHAVESIQDEMSEVYGRMLQLRPSTLEGYRALALAIVQGCWFGEVRRHEHDGTDDHGVAVLLSALTGVDISETVW